MEELKRKHTKFVKSLHALERSLKLFLRADAQDDLRESLVASNIKHFEMCYEAAWKFLKSYLEHKYNSHVDSPKKVIRESFALGILDAQVTQELLNMSEARNATVHDYDEETAQENCKRISNYYEVLKTLSQQFAW